MFSFYNRRSTGYLCVPKCSKKCTACKLPVCFFSPKTRAGRKKQWPIVSWVSVWEPLEQFHYHLSQNNPWRAPGCLWNCWVTKTVSLWRQRQYSLAKAQRRRTNCQCFTKKMIPATQQLALVKWNTWTRLPVTREANHYWRQMHNIYWAAKKLPRKEINFTGWRLSKQIFFDQVQRRSKCCLQESQKNWSQNFEMWVNHVLIRVPVWNPSDFSKRLKSYFVAEPCQSQERNWWPLC